MWGKEFVSFFLLVNMLTAVSSRLSTANTFPGFDSHVAPICAFLQRTFIECLLYAKPTAVKDTKVL